MNNYCCACGAYLKAPPQPFTIFKLPTSLSLCTILFYPPPTFPFLPSLQKQRTLPNSRRGGGLPRPLPRFSPLLQTPPTPHYPSPRTIKNRNSRHRRNHNSSFFIIHFSFSLITANPALSLAPHYQKSKFAPQVKQGCFNSGRTKSLHGRSDTNDRRRNHNSSFFIFHSSFIKAPPSPLSPSFLSAPFSHFLTASYCCRVYRSPTAYSLSFSCRPLSSPRFS